MFNLKYSIPKEIFAAFRNGSNYDYHFIIKELAIGFERKNSLGENNEKYKTFSVPIIIEFKWIGINGEEIRETVSCQMQFINSARFMASSLSNHIDNIAEGIHKIECKHGRDNKKCEKCGIKCKTCECCFEYKNVKDDSMLYKCLCCNKNYKKIWWKLKEEIC